jgi:hypothetical protein
MTNVAIATACLASGIKTPQVWEQIATRILTFKGTEAHPAGGCGYGGTDLVDAALQWLADMICASGCDTPQDCEEVGTIICCKGYRTDNLNY